MDINNEAKGFTFEIPSTVQTVFCDKTMTTEIGQDFILPDYQPEMRKLLRVTPSILPPSRFLGVGEAEFAGNVSFSVLYIGADGALYTTDLTAPYTFRVSLEDSDRSVGDRPLCIDAAITAESVIPRLQAPRKLNLKCRLRARLLGRGDEATDMRVSGERRDPTPEKLERTEICARILCGMGEALELTDEVNIPAGEGEPRLIAAGGTVRMTEASMTEEGVSCRGELYWKMTFTRDPIAPVFSSDTDAPTAPAPTQIETLTRRIPFSHTVELPLSTSPNGWEAMAYGTCTGIDTRVEDGKILCAATVIPEAMAMGSDKVTFVRDCFSTAYRSECEMRRYAVIRPVTCLNGNVTADGTVALSQIGIPKGAEILDLCGTASLGEITCERGRLILSGECAYQLLCRTPEGEFACTEFRLPLRYEASGDGKYDETAAYELSARATMLDWHARADGESIAIDAEWAIAACITAKEELEAVGEIRFEGDTARREGAYILCYPDRGETLWNIAKRYHTAIRPLAALNDLPGAADPASPQSLENVHFLMIG